MRTAAAAAIREPTVPLTRLAAVLGGAGDLAVECRDRPRQLIGQGAGTQVGEPRGEASVVPVDVLRRLARTLPEPFPVEAVAAKHRADVVELVGHGNQQRPRRGAVERTQIVLPATPPRRLRVSVDVGALD